MAGGKRRVLGRGVPKHRKELFPSSETHDSQDSHVPEIPIPETPVDDSETQYFRSLIIHTTTPETQNTSTPNVEHVRSIAQGARQTLHPDGLWFDDNTIANVITDIFQAHFCGPWINYKEVDDANKTRWWNQFKARFIWSRDLQNIVEKEYSEKAAKRLSDMSYNVSVRTLGRPYWMGETVFANLMKKREDEKFLKRSE
uniref:Transposase n=1 Tax=Chenopodium quinoa TaxID=63459 RepID=A0A803MRD7_CHEQI